MSTNDRSNPASLTGTLEEIRSSVQARYGATAQRVADSSEAASCCGPSEGSSGCCGATSESWDPITADLYEAGETAGLPAQALLASLGCGNPTALAELREGETVLDLGSGGGIDVLLSARRVGPTGKAYGLDMTDEMLALALENKARAGAANVEFLKGHIEAIPLPSNTVDVIISNCVINLSGDKRQVMKEAFRVLAPGGRFAVSDVIVREGLPSVVRDNMSLWTGCVSGALEESEFIALLTEAGFESPSIEPTRVYDRADAIALLQGTGLDDSLADEIAGKVMSGFVRATKPGGAARAPKKVRELVALGASDGQARACGCDDDCCSPGVSDVEASASRPEGEPELRHAVPGDLAAVERLLAGSQLPLDGVDQLLTDCVVAEEGGEVVGVAGVEVHGRAALLRSVAVASSWRSHGLGRALVSRVIRDTEARGIGDLYLLTTTAADYFPAFGFQTISRDEVPAAVQQSVEFQKACPASATVMRRQGTPGFTASGVDESGPIGIPE